MNKKVLLLLCTFLLISLFSMTTTNAGLFPSYPISGKITNYNLEPIEGAKITIESNGGLFKATATTDPNGNYSMSIAVTGQVWITISKDGYKTYRNQGWVGRENNWNYTIDPDKYPIRGKITDKNGDPIQGATISFEPNGGKMGIISATTDENGNYSVGVPVLGQAWVTIVKEGYKPYRNQAWVGRDNNWNYTLNP